MNNDLPKLCPKKMFGLPAVVKWVAVSIPHPTNKRVSAARDKVSLLLSILVCSGILKIFVPFSRVSKDLLILLLF
jgi:hypothetical protein